MSSPASSEHGKALSLGDYARKLSIAPKPSMSIHINDHYNSKVYTTGSEVSGHVAINPQTDVRFDVLQIVLLGTSKTRMDAVNIPQATSHTFLKLAMPIPDSSYPVPRIFEMGMTYMMPFTFVIPSTLTLNACNHHVANDSVQEHHVRLPPTVGSWEKDDFAPHMSRVQYVIKARVHRQDEDGEAFTKIMETGKEIKVLPAVAEDAPLNITKYDDLYTMMKSKTLRRTIISPKSGRVTITATQPAAAMLSPDGRTITSTTVPLNLEFEPASSDVRPPKVTGVTSKVTAVTYFSAGGINHYPNLKDWHKAFGTDGRGSYSGTTSVSVGPLGEVRWGRHLTAQARRDSGYGSETPSSSESDRPTFKENSKGSLPSPILHRAKLEVPIQLPAQKKAFVPTFHSCITSRVYVLWLTVTLVSGGASAHVTLNVPLQIGVNGTDFHRPNEELPPSFEEVEEADANEFLRPRIMSVPTVEFHHNADLPGYVRYLVSTS
ncbi:arrestin [Hypoxylon sp. EC38]|nr:arrestin [Hypoxylon sp. EC38]